MPPSIRLAVFVGTICSCNKENACLLQMIAPHQRQHQHHLYCHENHHATHCGSTTKASSACCLLHRPFRPHAPIEAKQQNLICSGIVFMWAAEGFRYLPQSRCSGVASWCQFRCCRCKLKAFAVLLALLLALLLLSCRVWWLMAGG